MGSSALRPQIPARRGADLVTGRAEHLGTRERRTDLQFDLDCLLQGSPHRMLNQWQNSFGTSSNFRHLRHEGGYGYRVRLQQGHSRSLGHILPTALGASFHPLATWEK